jgi:hypothetical protein
LSRIKFALACALSVSAFVGCEAPANALDPGRALLGRDHIVGEPGPIPGGHESGGHPSAVVPAIGDSCHTDDPKRICLGLKYVVYRDSSGEPVLSAQNAVNNVRAINGIWNQCSIAFQIDHFEAVKPADHDLRYQTANYPELDDIRNAFGDDSTLLIATTGTWDRTGSLGNTGANAWTAMPGGGPYGAVIERPVATFANIIAHELGHYLNLLHVGDTTDIMNAIIYTTSTKLSEKQCSTARAAAAFFWSKAFR